jgi:hypothetical protein
MMNSDKSNNIIDYDNESEMDGEEVEGIVNLQNNDAESDADSKSTSSDKDEGTPNNSEYYKFVLNRRIMIIEDMRKAYLRDVVTLKQIVTNLLIEKERKEVLQQHLSFLPSVDLSKALSLYAPEDAHLTVHPCEKCGGHLDIMFSDSKRVTELKKVLKLVQASEERFRLSSATNQALYEKAKNDLTAVTEAHKEEVMTKQHKNIV